MERELSFRGEFAELQTLILWYMNARQWTNLMNEHFGHSGGPEYSAVNHRKLAHRSYIAIATYRLELSQEHGSLLFESVGFSGEMQMIEIQGSFSLTRRKRMLKSMLCAVISNYTVSEQKN
jgi:hypothetical protein